MKILRLTLDGSYKRLSNQFFDFYQSNGPFLAFIGVNGTGKSQLFELIGETFSYLERYYRTDFKKRMSLGFSVTIEYQIRPVFDPTVLDTVKVHIQKNGNIISSKWIDGGWTEMELMVSDLPQHVVGYSSGLNENLQRSFLKNAVQFFDVMSIRSSRRKQLEQKLNERQIATVNRRFLRRYSNVFSPPLGDADDELWPAYLEESDTKIPINIFLDYDCSRLLMASLAILQKQELDNLFSEIPYRYPEKIVIQYDLRGFPIEEDTLKDIQQIVDIVSGDELRPTYYTLESTQKQLDELYGLRFLAAEITIDFKKNGLKEKLNKIYFNNPIRFFEKLYKIQLLGVRRWEADVKKSLRNDNFIGSVKKPLKTKLPLSIVELTLSNGIDSVEFDDLSDGEVQLIEIVGALRIFRDDNTLFIFDEPETHLNPAWRTLFHRYLQKSTGFNEGKPNRGQVLFSTHSPFLISSLHREDVFSFNRIDTGIDMQPVQSETFGASFEVLSKEFFGLKSLISQTAVEEIKNHIRDDDKIDAKKWIESSLGDSMEKAYLLRKLES